MTDAASAHPHHAVHIIVDGLVQGVWFRQSCANEATRLGVHGWVRNRDDGSVEAHAEGPRDAVLQLVAWCHRGPERARVERVTATEVSPLGATCFEVRR